MPDKVKTNKPRYIGGSTTIARSKWLGYDKKLRTAIKHISDEYNISPQLLAVRLAEEGFIDNSIKRYNKSKGKDSYSALDEGPMSTFYSTGSDDIGYLYEQGIIKTNRKIPFQYEHNINEKDREVKSAYVANSYDAIELAAADIAYRKKTIQKKFPKLKDDKLNDAINTAYRMGISGANKSIKANSPAYPVAKIYGDIDFKDIDSLIFGLPSDKNVKYKGTDFQPDDGHAGDYFSEPSSTKADYYNPIMAIPSDLFDRQKFDKQSVNFISDYSMKNGGCIPKRKLPKKNFGGILSDRDYEFSVAQLGDRNYFENEGVGLRSKYLIDAYNEGSLDLNDEAIAKARGLKANDVNTYNNMQNKIQTEILQARGIAKFGGLVGNRRKRMYWGGTTISDPSSVGWGTKIKTEDISSDEYNADGEGIIGGSAVSGLGTGLGIGATVGLGAAALGAGAGSVLGPIGMGVGALIGGIVGLFTGSKRKKQEEQRRQELIAAQKEAERQQTLGNMQNKVENDVATIRQQTNESYSEGSGFYAKLGGLIPRRKLAMGGQVLPNSTNSVVAYGATHEQPNASTGGTGIPFGNAEIEGGGNYNGKQYAGEVVRKTNEGDQVFSDTLKVPGTKNTFADYAKALTDVKGAKEKLVSNYGIGLNIGLNRLTKSKLNKLETGTNIRNLEKDAYRMNQARGEAEFIDRKTSELFDGQEQYATMLGLREPTDNLKMGGIVGRPKYKFGFMEMGLTANLAGSALGIIGNALNTRANRKAIDFERSLAVPKQSRVEAAQYSTDYDIDQELQELTTQERRASTYIKDNTSNVQVARNSVGKLAIDAQLARNKIYGSKKDYQRQRYDMNLAERVNATNRNNQISYEDSLAEYNKMVQLNSMGMQNRTQGLQGVLQGFEGVGSALNNYASGKLYEKLWARGVKTEMGNMACGGMIKRKKRK